MSAWQTVEEVMLVSTLVISRTIPIIAAASSFFFAISPLSTTRTIQRHKSTLKYSFAPFFFFFVQNLITLLYAYVTWNYVIASTATLSSCLGGYYVCVYYKHSKEKKSAQHMLLLAMFGILLLALHALPRPSQEAQFMIGIPSLGLSVMTSSSPLLQIRDIIRQKDASCLPFGMSVMTAVCGMIWLIYGYMLHDPWIIIPNIIGLSMGIIQVFLAFLYPKSKSDGNCLSTSAKPLGMEQVKDASSLSSLSVTTENSSTCLPSICIGRVKRH